MLGKGCLGKAWQVTINSEAEDWWQGETWAKRVHPNGWKHNSKLMHMGGKGVVIFPFTIHSLPGKKYLPWWTNSHWQAIKKKFLIMIFPPFLYFLLYTEFLGRQFNHLCIQVNQCSWGWRNKVDMVGWQGGRG